MFFLARPTKEPSDTIFFRFEDSLFLPQVSLLHTRKVEEAQPFKKGGGTAPQILEEAQPHVLPETPTTGGGTAPCAARTPHNQDIFVPWLFGVEQQRRRVDDLEQNS